MAACTKDSGTASIAADVLILGNHGLVVGADDCDSAESLLRDVEQRLHVEVSAGSEPPDAAALERLAEGTEWRIADDPEVHVLGTNRSLCDLLPKVRCIPIIVFTWDLRWPCSATGNQ